MIVKNILYFTLLAFLCPISTLAQKWEFGLQMGTAGYMGDFNQEGIFQFNDWAAGASAKYNLNPTWGIRMNLSQLHIHGDDVDSKYIFEQERGKEFGQSLTEFAVLGDFNFFKFEPDHKKNEFTTYISAGVGAVHFSLPDSEKSNRELLIRYGAGFKYNIKEAWSVGAEFAYRTVFSDDLDGMPAPTDLKRIDDGRPYDSYMTAQLTLIYTLFCKTCPRW